MKRSFRVKVNGELYEVEVEEQNTGQSEISQAPMAKPQAPQVPSPAPAAPVTAVKEAAPKAAGSGQKITAPLPGTILDLKVASGAQVKAGQVVAVLEAMKMENEIVSPADGVVQEILVHRGSTVSSGDVLMTVG